MRLPNEILDHIYSYYWSHLFYENVISQLKENVKNAAKAKIFIQRHILYNVANIGKYYLQKYNNILKNISEDKGLCMFLSKETDYIFKHMHNMKVFNKYKYPYLCCYCCIASGRMRYTVVSEFAAIV
uniref:Uncharacterized protein n=1 Tax=viral metagenome TaxID=1070528 RepID=A0A6C0C1K7_9ZZZZ